MKTIILPYRLWAKAQNEICAFGKAMGMRGGPAALEHFWSCDHWRDRAELEASVRDAVLESKDVRGVISTMMEVGGERIWGKDSVDQVLEAAKKAASSQWIDMSTNNLGKRTYETFIVFRGKQRLNQKACG